jgi:DNA-binding LacI/PurR family transcriptional regulator
VRALGEAGLEEQAVLQVNAESTERSGYDALETLLARGVSFDAVFAASDLIAIGAMRALADHGLKVPDDVALAGFDDIPMASFVSPPLTTVLQDTKLAGEILVDNLLQLIRGEPAESAMLPAKLIVRKSSVRLR